MRQSFTAVVLFALAALARPATAQRSALIAPTVKDALVNEISGDIAFEHIRWFTHYHRPMGGGEGFEAVAKYVEQKARDYGLEDVRVIRQKTNTPSWSPRLGELTLTEPYTRRLAFSPEAVVSLADYSRATDIPSAELIDVGAGAADADYEGKEVAGKIVLATGSPGHRDEPGRYFVPGLGSEGGDCHGRRSDNQVTITRARWREVTRRSS